MKARLAEGYAPDWDVDLRYGKRGEAFVSEFLSGLIEPTGGRLTVEVKSDRKWVDTGNIWIEMECRRRDGWQPSGVMASNATMWALVLGETLIVGVPTVVLRRIATDAWEDTDTYGKPMFRSEEKDGTHPTRGVKLALGLFIMRVRTELRRLDQAA